MKDQQLYQPDWISEEDTAKWLGVVKTTLFRWRTSLGLAWTNINGKTVMYDRKQINAILNNNSTYKFQGIKLSSDAKTDSTSVANKEDSLAGAQTDEAPVQGSKKKYESKNERKLRWKNKFNSLSIEWQKKQVEK